MKYEKYLHSIAVLLLYVLSFCQQEGTEDLKRNVRSQQAQIDKLLYRTVKLESRFVGHKIIIAKNGAGVTVKPCEFVRNGKVDKNCQPDSKGITISDSLIKDFEMYGVLAVEDTNVNGVDINNNKFIKRKK